MKQIKNNKYLSFGYFIFNYFSKINFSSRVCILVILSSLFLPFCAGGSEDPGTKVVDPPVVAPPTGEPETITKVGVQSYFCTNGVKKDPVNLAVASASSPDKQGCQSCNARYRIASGSFSDDGSSCVRRTCADNGDDAVAPAAVTALAGSPLACPRVTSSPNTYDGCYFDYMRSGHEPASEGMQGKPTEELYNSECVQVDSDNDKLIDITTLTQLYNMRHNTFGDFYHVATSTAAGACGSYGGAEGDVYTRAACAGYELMNNLSFDKNKNGITYDSNGLDPGDDAVPYFVVDSTDSSNIIGGWEPIVNFASTFDGNGNTITGLAIRKTRTGTGTGTVSIGMFGSIRHAPARSAVIRDINLVDNLAEYYSAPSTAPSGRIHVGGLVGTSLENVITGSNSVGTITGSSTSGEAKGPFATGGLVGFQEDLKIESSHATGSVSYVSSSANFFGGGLVGRSKNGKIITSYASGAVTGGAGDDRLGGLVGESLNGQIIDSSATGTVTVTVTGGAGSDYLGGLVGRSRNGEIITSFATGAVTGGAGDDLLGGLVGESKLNSQIITSYATGTVRGAAGNDYLGGLVGKSSSSQIIDSFASGAVTGGADNDKLGGLVGESLNSQIIASHATSDVTSEAGANYLGGLVGYFKVDLTKSGTIAASYAIGAVTGGANIDRAGGLVGDIIAQLDGMGGSTNGAVTVIASYATGAVSGLADDDVLGGLIGRIDNTTIPPGNTGQTHGGSSVVFTATYATGAVTGGAGSDSLGGLIGILNGAAIIASYATNSGGLNAASGSRQFVGRLVGIPGTPRITESYGFTVPTGIDADEANVGIAPNGIAAATGLTSAGLISAMVGNAGDKWDKVVAFVPPEQGSSTGTAAIHTSGAWFFGTSAAPTPQFNDYDGLAAGTTGTIYNCSAPSTPAMNFFEIKLPNIDKITTTRSCGSSITQ